MKRLGFMLALALAACSGNGYNPLNNPEPEVDGGGGGGGGNASGIPDDLARNISTMSYNASKGTLSVTLTGLDADAIKATFTRTPGLDVGPYVAFTTQDDPLDRLFTALAATSFDGSVTAGVAADGGQFGKYFPGGFYVQNAAYVPPSVSGLASYAGRYVAVSNVDAPGTHLLSPPAGTDPAVLPAESARIDGMIFINIQFGEDQLNGVIFDRQYTDYGTSLPDVLLLPADVTSDGSFYGTAEGPNQTAIGTYGGVLGGTGGTSIAGLVQTTDYDPTNGNALEEETGVFVLTRCGLAGANAAACNGAESLGK
jgi:hypothetical protein